MSAPLGSPQFGRSDIGALDADRQLLNALLERLAGFQGTTSAAGAATTTQFPADGDWGFHINTSTGGMFFAYNKAGVIKTEELT